MEEDALIAPLSWCVHALVQMCLSPGLCLCVCVWENMCSAIATLHKHYKLHNTLVKGTKFPSKEKEMNQEEYMNCPVFLFCTKQICTVSPTQLGFVAALCAPSARLIIVSTVLLLGVL